MSIGEQHTTPTNNPDRLLGLAALCESASRADRELDATIHIAVGLSEGNPVATAHGWCAGSASNPNPVCAPRYTASLVAAVSLVPRGHTWAAGSCGEEQIPWACVTQNAFPCRDFAADAPTPALALTAAALRALAMKEGSAGS